MLRSTSQQASASYPISQDVWKETLWHSWPSSASLVECVDEMCMHSSSAIFTRLLTAMEGS